MKSFQEKPAEMFSSSNVFNALFRENVRHPSQKSHGHSHAIPQTCFLDYHAVRLRLELFWSKTLSSSGWYTEVRMLKLANQVIVLDRLNINGHLHRLSRELHITVGHDDDRLTLSNEEFGLLVSAPTLEEGIAGISDELSMLWEVYVADNPANLTRDALRLRSNLKSLVAAGAGSWGTARHAISRQHSSKKDLKSDLRVKRESLAWPS